MSLYVCYLLESVGLSGGVRVVFDQARALIARGHRVTIRAVFGDCDWYPWPMAIDRVASLAELGKPFGDAAFPDVVVATYWTTVEPAVVIGCPRTFHLCQGHEGSFLEFKHWWPAIEAAYRRPIPKLVIGPWLTRILRQCYGNDSFPVYEIGQLVDTDSFYPGPEYWWRPMSRPRRVLVVGPWELALKGIDDALTAVELVRGRGIALNLIRVSQQVQTPTEAMLTKIDEYYSCLPTGALADLYRSVDVLLSASHSEEGFGLPVAEALACGVPVIATRIPSYEKLAGGGRNLVLAPQGDPPALAAALGQLLVSPWKHWRMRLRGPRLIRSLYSAAKVARRLETLFLANLDTEFRFRT